MMNKVLVISYYWPPAGGPGVQRWLKFTTYLPEYGIEPVLYIPENPSYPITDPSLQEEIPAGIRYFSKRIAEPLQWAGTLFGKEAKKISKGVIPNKEPSLKEKALIWIRGNLFIPDARILWVKPSIRYLKEVLEREGINTIITTGPPHSVHLIGHGLKKALGVRWVADFRDPWTSIGYHHKLLMGGRARKLHKKWEKKVLTAADKIIVTSKTTKKEFEAITHKPVVVITNGFEPADFDGKQVDRDNYFRLAHIGSLLSGRNPMNLWQALSEMIEEQEVFKNDFRLQLVGVVANEVLESIRNHGLEPFVEHLAYLPHAEAVRYQQKAQLLLLLEIDAPETIGILPGKLFEYLGARRPVLAIGPEGWEAGSIIRETGAGVVATYSDKELIKQNLLKWYKEFNAGELRSNARGIEKYNRKELTGQLARELQWE